MSKATSRNRYRDSFLTIIEFLNVPRQRLQSVMALLQPRPGAGDMLYKECIEGNDRFHGNDFYESESVKLCFGQPENCPGWYPMDVRQLTRAALIHCAELRAIRYTAMYTLIRLSFIFGTDE